MSIRYVNMSGTMKPIMEFGSFRNVQILELPKSRMLVFCLHCGGEIRKFKDMVSCIFVTLKAVFGTAVATLKRDKRKKIPPNASRQTRVHPTPAAQNADL